MARKIKRGDTRPGALITCKDGTQTVDLTLASSLRLLGRLGGASVIDRAVTGNAVGQVLIETWEPSDTANVGLLELEVEATWADGSTQTFPGGSYLEVEIVQDLG